jgi:hypothetical protein
MYQHRTKRKKKTTRENYVLFYFGTQQNLCAPETQVAIAFILTGLYLHTAVDM